MSVEEEDVDELAAALAAGEGEEVEAEELEVPEIPEEAVEEEVAGEENAEEDLDVAEHLREAAEGSIKLKRLLERDEDDGPASKKPKTAEQVLIQKLLMKFGTPLDRVVKHVLQQQTLEELQAIDAAGFKPALNNEWKSAAELLSRYCSEARERKSCGGGALDSIAAFKFRWKLTPVQDKVVRALSHKDLRYVLTNYDGSIPLEDVAEAAKDNEVDEVCTETALPDAAGLTTFGRFTRLELIDPLCDAAVFGDANLTFSKRLAKHRKALGHVGRIIATTFEDLPTLKDRYPEIQQSIEFLEEHYAEVYHGVDCTRIAMDPKFAGMESSLGAVYYNFPHSGVVGGFFDAHPLVNWRHENLMRLFFRGLRTFVKPGGCVKVASNANAVGVRYSFVTDSALENEFVHVETMPFLEWHLHRYGRSYGDRRDKYKRPDAQNNQSYNAQKGDSDMVYCFVYAPSGEPVGAPTIRLPPTLKALSGSNDGPFKSLVGPAKENLAKQLHNRFITETSGTHVG